LNYRPENTTNHQDLPEPFNPQIPRENVLFRYDVIAHCTPRCNIAHHDVTARHDAIAHHKWASCVAPRAFIRKIEFKFKMHIFPLRFKSKAQKPSQKVTSGTPRTQPESHFWHTPKPSQKVTSGTPRNLVRNSLSGFQKLTFWLPETHFLT
jgi:hypothetical protein